MNSYTYFDYNATATVSPCVIEEVSKILSTTSNSSSIHALGQSSRMILEDVRDSLLNFIGLDRKEYKVIFTSGATEAINLILRGVTVNLAVNSIAVSTIEHSAIRETAKDLGAKSTVEVLQISSGIQDGKLKFDLPSAESLGLIALMAVNNETGHVTNFDEIFSKIKSANPSTITLCDASQLIGKYDMPDFKNTDAIIFAGHKFGALQGVGALVIKKSIDLKPLITGGPQELRFRGGTENVLAIWSFGKALEVIAKSQSARLQKMKALTDVIKNQLKLDSRIRINFSNDTVVPNTISVTIPGVSASDLVVALDLEKVCVSSGSACSSGKTDPSHVLIALGMGEQEARSTVRISVGPELSIEEAQFGAQKILDVVGRFCWETCTAADLMPLS